MLLQLLLLGLAFRPLVLDEDWTGWRGPRGDGTSAGSPPVAWSENEHVRWRVDLPGAGLSSPIVCGARVFLTAAVPTGKKRTAVLNAPSPQAIEIEEQEFLVLALERASGKELWRKRVNQAMPHEATHPTNTYATPTPTTDGARVYCSFGSFGIYALTPSGALAWQVDLGDLECRGHGEGSSPLLYEGGLFLLWAHSGASFLVRLDAATGKETWRAPVPEGNNCSTPIVRRCEGRDEVLVSGRYVIAFDPKTGKEAWRFGDERSDGITSMATPVVLEELVIVPGVNRRDSRALFFPGAGEPAEVLWSSRFTDNIPSPLVHDGRVIFLKGESGQLAVLDGATGEAEFGPERVEGLGSAWASPLIAGERLYLVGREGTTVVYDLGPEPRPLARNTLDDEFDTTPSVAGDELFLRGKKRLYCVSAVAGK
jgi:outer membrane protein assembly factor BamB